MQFSLWSVVLVFMLGGCATALKPGKGLPAGELFARACEPGAKVYSVVGTVWMKIQSSELNGQFSAHVLAVSTDQLKLEFTNIFGGAEAMISIQGDHYSVTSADQKKEKKDEGYGSWGGIPIHWMTDLFLGKIPCPTSVRQDIEIKMEVSEEGGLSILTFEKKSHESQKYLYRFKEWNGRPWPEWVRWERLSDPKTVVEFKFDHPDEETLSPIKWEARSIEGAIKVKWSDRAVSLSKKNTELK